MLSEFDQGPLRHHVEWIRNDSIPFWRERAMDESGLFYETLSLEGSPQPDVERRLRTGMRQAFVFAEAANAGLANQESIEVAERIIDRLRSVAWAQDGKQGWAAKFDSTGRITDGRRDLYDHAFTLLALASLFRATGNPKYKLWIDETVGVVDSALTSPHGGWSESDRDRLPRRQNPHMHLFEASLALFEVTRDPWHIARAAEIFSLLRDRFFDKENGVLLEFFGPAWERSVEFRSNRLDPGHMAEWTWLLRRYARSVPVNVDELCARLFQSAVRLGLTKDGFLVDEVNIAGEPLVNRRRLWPQTEYLKALIVQASHRDGGVQYAEAAQFVGHLHGQYLTGVPQGAWCDEFALDGTRSAKNIPASTLYHLLVPALEILLL